MTNKENLLKFGKGNAKLGKKVVTFSLPAGHSCPFALDCLSKSDKETGKITDGKETIFRCFAASSEAVYKNVRLSRWHNFELLKTAKNTENITNLILQSLPKKCDIVRIHVSGDFFNMSYLQAWVNVAKLLPDTLFYAYTKSLVYLIGLELPENLSITASKGGKLDKLITENNMKFAEVVYSEQEAKDKNLLIDHDDSLAMYAKNSFALLIHGTQPKNSKGSKAIKEMKLKGTKFSYSK
jgi:hypothetical protein